MAAERSGTASPLTPDARINAEPADDSFAGAPPLSFNTAKAARLAGLVVLLGWLPLPLLVFFHDHLHSLGNFSAFATDAGAHARFLVAAPLFVLAEIACARQLGAIATHLGRSGLVPAPHYAEFNRLVIAARQSLRSPRVATGSIILACVLVLALFTVVSVDEIPRWQRLDRNVVSPTPAGWWHMLVSLPLLTMLFLGWIWRLCIWTYFLLRVSRLDLQIVPAHPDRCGGLAFVSLSLRAFSLVAVAMIVVVAGRVANDAFHHDVALYAQGYLVAASIAVVTVMFVTPLTAFSGALVREWRRGIFGYGALAAAAGRQFEAKWLGNDGTARAADMLASPDFSAAADLYQSVASVQQMRFVPLDLKSFAAFVVVLLLPFLPVLLLSIPADQVLAALKKLLF